MTNIQNEVIKIHHKYGTTELANYKIQLLCEKYAKEYHEQEVKKLNIPDVSNCTCVKEKRYCKGCFRDVTETMYCDCGEQPLTKENTYNDDDLKAMNL